MRRYMTQEHPVLMLGLPFRRLNSVLKVEGYFMEKNRVTQEQPGMRVDF